MGKYRRRFAPIIDQLKKLPRHSQILELCFGDTVIADYCKKSDLRWLGLDMNAHFVKRAQNRGYEAFVQDITAAAVLPTADVCIMIGSLYHFHSNVKKILSKMLQAGNLVIISEPVSNLSNKKGIIGALAKRSANAGKGNEAFRYNRASFLSMLQANSVILHYRVEIIHDRGKDLIVKLIKE